MRLPRFRNAIPTPPHPLSWPGVTGHPGKLNACNVLLDGRVKPGHDSGVCCSALRGVSVIVRSYGPPLHRGRGQEACHGSICGTPSGAEAVAGWLEAGLVSAGRGSFRRAAPAPKGKRMALRLDARNRRIGSRCHGTWLTTGQNSQLSPRKSRRLYRGLATKTALRVARSRIAASGFRDDRCGTIQADSVLHNQSRCHPQSHVIRRPIPRAVARLASGLFGVPGLVIAVGLGPAHFA